MENRRRAERQSALWMGRCHVEDEPSDLWRECALIDVSTFGVGIDLCHPDPVELLGMWQDGEVRLHLSRRITVRLELGPSVDVTVAGEVRNAGSGPDGIVRAGIEFVGLTESERFIVDLVERRAMTTMPRHAQGAPRPETDFSMDLLRAAIATTPRLQLPANRREARLRVELSPQVTGATD